MQDFTIHQNQEINSRILADLQYVRDRIVNEIDCVDALILVGGFGRGEGTVRITDDGIKPMNDYDIVVVYDTNRLNRVVVQRKIFALSNELADGLDIRFVDLIPRSRTNLTTIEPTKFNFDMAKCSYTIYQRENRPLKNEWAINPADIPLFEVEKLLLNRLVCFLESIRFEGGEFTEETDNASMFTVRQVAKGIIAAADAHLIIENEYVPKYTDKVEACDSIGLGEDFLALLRDAVRVKVDPNSHSPGDPVEFWFKGREFYERSFDRFAKNAYDPTFDDWEEFIKFSLDDVTLRERSKPLLNRDLSLLDRISGFVKKDATIPTGAYLAELAVLFSLHPKKREVDQDLLSEAVELLNIDDSSPSWETVRQHAVRNWFLANH
jgi:hypothetical protein